MVFELTQLHSHDGNVCIVQHMRWWVVVAAQKSLALGTYTCSCLSVARQWDLSQSPNCYIKSILQEASWSMVPSYQTICTCVLHTVHILLLTSKRDVCGVKTLRVYAYCFINPQTPSRQKTSHWCKGWGRGKREQGQGGVSLRKHVQ